MKAILQTKKFWVELFIMTFGMFFGALAVHFFLVPSQLVIGSIPGLSIVLFRLTGLPVSVVTFFINIILLIFAYIFIGKEFGAKTVYTALIISPWLYLLETFFPVAHSVMGDPWLDLLCFVLILSVAQTILFHINASTGGLDIVAKIINKYWHIEMGTALTLSGAVICCSAFVINDFNLVILGLIGTWINGLAVDYFTAGINRKKKVCIISPEYQKINDYITQDLQRGVTLFEIVGGYSGNKSREIEVLLTQSEFGNLMEYIRVNEFQAFITASNVSEVYGVWNNKRRKIII